MHALALRCAADPLWLASQRDGARPSAELQKELLAIKGFGRYAAASCMMLLGRYDELPQDTVFAQFMRAKHFNGEELDLTRALKLYDGWGRWKALAYWLELNEFYDRARD